MKPFLVSQKSFHWAGKYYRPNLSKHRCSDSGSESHSETDEWKCSAFPGRQDSKPPISLYKVVGMCRSRTWRQVNPKLQCPQLWKLQECRLKHRERSRSECPGVWWMLSSQRKDVLPSWQCSMVGACSQPAIASRTLGTAAKIWWWWCGMTKVLRVKRTERWGPSKIRKDNQKRNQITEWWWVGGRADLYWAVVCTTAQTPP